MLSTSHRGLLILVLLLAGIRLSAQISSDFSGNADGWTTPNDADGTIAYSATGGNPGGFVFGTPFSFNLGAGTIYVPFYFVAPGKFSGNRSGYYNGTLRYDIQQSSTGTPNVYAEVIITNSAGISLYYYPSTPHQPVAAPAWTTFSIRMSNASGFWKTADSPTGPLATEAQVLNMLTNLEDLNIRGLYRDANTTNRLDNVTLMPPIVINTQPTSTPICNGATATFTTAASGNPSITYQWQRETTPGVWTNVTNGGGYSGATTATLSINTTGNFGAGNYRARVSGTAVLDEFTNSATLTINALPTAPTTTGNSACTATTAAVTLSAAGGSAGQYRWYTVATLGTPIAGQTNNNYTTPLISATTIYYVAINNGTCQSTRTPVTATINTPPNAPITTGSSVCTATSATLTLSASGGSAGQYRWYIVATLGTPLAGQTNSTFTTPALSTTTIYYVSINNGTCEGNRTPVTATINTPPNAPSANGNASCGAAAITLSASGGSAGQYRWYTVATLGSPIAGQTNSTYTTAVISATTNYFVAINNGTCESTRTVVTATINTPPNAPTVTGAASCPAASVTLSASGGSNGQYRWYTNATGPAISGETNATYATPVLSTTTIYYVSINNGTCESIREPVTATVAEPGCDNHPPVIETTPVSTQIEGIITLDLTSLISDSDDNIDLSTLTIVTQPASGAIATINGSNLVIDYRGVKFSGSENITIQVCDIYDACVQQAFAIEVVGAIVIYNAVSANGDNQNEIFRLEHIGTLEDTRKNHVSIFNRWGDVVWEGDNYDNTDVVFAGKSKDNNDLPSGTYFYKIEFSSGRKSEAGYLSVKR